MKLKNMFVKGVLSFGMMACALLFAGAKADAATYSCGANVTATLDESTGVMTLSGSGEMTEVPWSSWDSPVPAQIRSVVVSKGVTTIWDSAFENCSNLTSVTLPDGLKKIGFYAFKGCTSLTSITIPKTVTDSGGYCFKGSGLSTVTFAAGSTVVPSHLLIEAKNLTTVNMPDSITEIDISGFENCEKLASIKLPAKLKSLGFYAFKGCTSLTNITIPKTVTECGGYCFKNSALKNVIFQEGAKRVPGSMFADAPNLKNVNLAKSITSIDVSAFENSGVEEITLPYYCKEIGFYAFKDCKSLKSITIYQAVTDISGYAFKNVTGITVYGKKGSLAQKMAKTNGFTFKVVGVPALKGITYTAGNLKYTVVNDAINNKGTVKVVGIKKAKKTLTIPKMVKLESYKYTVVSIGKNAFKKASKVKTVKIQSAAITSMGKKAFSGIHKKAKIYVPKKKYTAYNKMLKKAGVTSKMKVKKK